MPISIDSAEMIYNGSQIGAANKVPAGQSFLIAIAILIQQGDDNLLIIEGTYNSSTDTVSSLSKTFDEIADAIGDGAFCVLKLTEGTNIYYLPIEKHTESNNGNVNGAYFVDTELLKKRVYIYKLPPLVGGPPKDTTTTEVSDLVHEVESLFLFGGIFNAANNTVTSLTANFGEIDYASYEEKVLMMYLNDSVTDELYYLALVGFDNTGYGYIFADDVRLHKKVTIYDDDGTTVATVADIAKSWNDLTDKPFYEETVPAINLSNPDYTSAGAVSLNVTYAGEYTIPCKAVWMADAIQKTNMIGAELTMQQEADGNGDLDNITVEIESNRIVDVTNGYMICSEGIAYLFCALQDNVTFTMLDGNNDQMFSVTLPTAGVYFVQIDASELFGVVLYTSALTKAATTVVHKLDSKFVPDSTFWVNCTVTQENGSVACTVDKTFAEISAAITALRDVRMRMATPVGVIAELQMNMFFPNDSVIFAMSIDIGSQNNTPVANQGIKMITIKIDSSDNVTQLSSDYT